MNEFDLIRSFVAGASVRNKDVQVGPGDDCAIIPPFAISTDMSVENVHFRRDWSTPQEIGYRAAAAALSDLAAVAASPVAAFVSFAFGKADADAWAPAVMNGVNQLLNEFDVVLAGGDITRSQHAVINVTVLGRVEKPVLRSGACPGDGVWVTGSLGIAHFQPRIQEALFLNDRVTPSSMIDLSDGIGGDAHHIANASGVRLRIDATLLPLAHGATLVDAVQRGEDYELCFTAIDSEVERIREEFQQQFGVALTRVGRVESGTGVIIGKGPDAAGYNHFA